MQADSRSLQIGEADFELIEYQAQGEHTLLWLTSATDSRSLFSDAATKIAAEGINVITTDILDAYLFGNSRGAMITVPPADIAELLDEVVSDVEGRLIVMAAGRVAIPVLRGINSWQQGTGKLQSIAGSLLISPNLYVGVPELGGVGKFYPVAEVSNIPIFLMQPRQSVRTFRLREIASQLGTGGSPVYTGIVNDVRGGFFFNPDEIEDPAPVVADLVTSSVRAVRLLVQQPPVSTPPESFTSKEVPARTNLRKGLVSVQQTTQAPALVGAGLDGQSIDLEDFDDRIVIVNFWATWCPPCLEEIPSMTDFYENYRRSDKKIELIAVSVGETVEEVSAFMAQSPLPFTIAMDEDGSIARAWKVFTYPTTIVLNAKGEIAAGSVGVVDWTLPETQQVIDDLLAGL